jgi:hypothetical protein
VPPDRSVDADPVSVDELDVLSLPPHAAATMPKTATTAINLSDRFKVAPSLSKLSVPDRGRSERCHT